MTLSEVAELHNISINRLKTRLKLSSFVLVEGEDFRRTRRFVIVGGNTSCQIKIKEHFPKIAFISVENMNFDTDLAVNADVIFINVGYLNDALYFIIK